MIEVNVCSDGSVQIIDIQEWFNAAEGGSHIVTHEFWPDQNAMVYNLEVETTDDEYEDDKDSPNIDIYKVKTKKDALGLLQLHKEELKKALKDIEDLEKLVNKQKFKLNKK